MNINLTSVNTVDAKTMFAAIKNTIGGNEAHKKQKKEDTVEANNMKILVQSAHSLLTLSLNRLQKIGGLLAYFQVVVIHARRLYPKFLRILPPVVRRKGSGNGGGHYEAIKRPRRRWRGDGDGWEYAGRALQDRTYRWGMLRGSGMVVGSGFDRVELGCGLL
ncbi:hypothetical protein Tco_0046581 [Tanacetum coccineum]